MTLAGALILTAQRSEQVQPPASVPVAGSSVSSVPGRQQGVLQRHDAPPQGVAAQVAFFAGAGGPDVWCDPERLRSTRAPTVMPPAGGTTVEVFDMAAICFAGFSSDRLITVQVRRPDDAVKRWTQMPVRGYGFAGLPDDPLGRYTVEATQGAARASLTLRLVPASQPGQQVLYGPSGSGPTAVALSGFPPNGSIALHFYGPGPCETILQGRNRGNILLPYITTISVRADQNGQATYPWPGTNADQGCFGVLADKAGRVQPAIRVGLAAPAPGAAPPPTTLPTQDMSPPTPEQLYGAEAGAACRREHETWSEVFNELFKKYGSHAAFPGPGENSDGDRYASVHGLLTDCLSRYGVPPPSY